MNLTVLKYNATLTRINFNTQIELTKRLIVEDNTNITQNRFLNEISSIISTTFIAKANIDYEAGSLE